MSDTLNLPQEIKGRGWPWTTELDRNANGKFGRDPLCGPIEYDVLINNQRTREQDDLITMPDQATILLKPMPGDAVQTYNMILCGKLKDYPEVEECVNFMVTVTECMPAIVPPPQGSIQNISGYTWHDPAIEIDIKNVLAQYSQDPPCDLEMTYNVKYEKFPVQFPGQLHNLPAEASYDTDSSKLSLQKCSD